MPGLAAGCRCYAVRWCQHHEADHDPGHSLSGHPMGTVYTVLPLSGALIVVYSVLNIIDLATDSVEEHSSTSAE